MKFSMGNAQKIKLTLSAQFKAQGGFKLPVSKDAFAKLWQAEQRMKFVLFAANCFNELLKGPQPQYLERSIREFADGGGIQ